MSQNKNKEKIEKTYSVPLDQLFGWSTNIKDEIKIVMLHENFRKVRHY